MQTSARRSGAEPGAALVRVNLLGPFAMTLGERRAGPWLRPSAKRLCELVMLSARLRVRREAACEVLFPNLGPDAAANALRRALSMAKAALSPLGDGAAGLLRADRNDIWVPEELALVIDLTAHEESLRSALRISPGPQRDLALAAALREEGVLLEDEPYADWALRPREALEPLRQRARLELARDRTRGKGRSQPEAVVEAWEACLAHDPTSEEAASALMRLYAAQGRRQLACGTYERCRAALEDLGLRASPALEEALRATVEASAPRARGTGALATERSAPRLGREERRLVSVLFAELSGPVGTGHRLDPEDMRQVVGEALAGVIAEVEGLGGTVTSVSGGGLEALFGAPEAHEDDPERAVRAGFRIMQVPGTIGDLRRALSVRVGIETGPAVVGPLGARVEYGAVGEVVGAAAALQSAAKAGSVLVGPATRAAVAGIFEWGPTEEVAVVAWRQAPRRFLPGAAQGASLRLPRPSRAGAPGSPGRPPGGAVCSRRSAAGGHVGDGLGRCSSWATPASARPAWCRNAASASWPGSGPGPGRLPLWLEGRCASYASSTPYGLYQQLLSAWVGVVPEEGEQVVRPALERAMRAIFGGQDEQPSPVGPHDGSTREASEEAQLARLSPEGLQRATFAAVRAVVARLISRGPTVLVLEDLHWADPTSLRLTEELASPGRGRPPVPARH